MARPWTTREIQLLRTHGYNGAPWLAIQLERSERSVRSKAGELGISLRRPGVRAGLLVGQRRGSRWLDSADVPGARGRLEQIREDVLAGRLDLGRVYEQIVERLSGSRPPCPRCASRPIERDRTGLCEICHYRALAEAQRESSLLADAKRELGRRRQEISRSRRARAIDEEELDDDLDA